MSTTESPLPPSTRQRQREATRDLIFEVAMQEIAEVGLAKARIEHIARKAGVTRPTFYAHFPSKEDLLRELQARTEATTLQLLERRLEESGNGRVVHRLVDAIFDLANGTDGILRREAFGLMVREPRRGPGEGVGDWMMGNALFAFLTRQLEQAQAHGEIAARMPADELTRILMTAIFGFLAIEGAPAEERRALAHRAVTLLIAGAGAITADSNP